VHAQVGAGADLCVHSQIRVARHPLADVRLVLASGHSERVGERLKWANSRHTRSTRSRRRRGSAPASNEISQVGQPFAGLRPAWQDPLVGEQGILPAH